MLILTMTDVGFLAQTLVLHRSLARGRTAWPGDGPRSGPFARASASSALEDGTVTLRILCLDEPSRRFLEQRRLAGTELVDLTDLERADPALAAVRAKRSWREYCWTAIPSLCRQALETAPADGVVAWIDADIEFKRDPRLLIGALGEGSVLLTPHSYHRAYPISAPAWELTELYGRFNGGSIAFRNDPQGSSAVTLWRQRTLDWCYDRCEPGRYGNQLHLDDFPERFGRARIIEVPGGIVGPWNGSRFRIGSSPTGPTADGEPVLAYHYQSLRLVRAGSPLLGALAPHVYPVPAQRRSLQAQVEPHYRISLGERRVFWRPYVRRLGAAMVQITRAQPELLHRLAAPPSAPEMLAGLRESARLERSRIPQPLLPRLVRRATHAPTAGPR